MSATSFIHATSTKLVLASIFAASLVACGGSDYVPPPTVVATTNAVVTQKAALAAIAIAAAPVTAPVALTALQAGTATVTVAGAPAASLSAPVTLAFTAKPAGAAATVDTGVTLVSGTQTATGENTFGSCDITVTGVAGTGPFGIGMRIVWPFCQFTLPTQNVTFGSTTNLAPVFQFGDGIGAPNSITSTVKIPVTISSTGSVTAAGQNTGSTVSGQSSTGATGA